MDMSFIKGVLILFANIHREETPLKRTDITGRLPDRSYPNRSNKILIAEYR